MDWLAAIIELIGGWLLGNKDRLAFVLLLICNILWIYVAITKGVYGLLLVVVPAIIINIRNFMKWGNEK